MKIFLRYILNYQDNKTRVVLNTPNFIVIVDMAPISDNHLLIIPKFHYNSFCEIPSTLHYEFYFIIKIIKQTYNNEDILMFEHGSGSDNSIIKGCGNSVSLRICI